MNDLYPLSPALQALQKTFQGYPVTSLLWLLGLCLNEEGQPKEEAEALLAILQQGGARIWEIVRAAAPGFERLLAYGLSRPESEVRARCAELFGALDGHRERQVAKASLVPLAALLSAPELEVALASARRLWIFAGSGAELSSVRAALEAALQSPHEDVPFFASMALSHHAYRSKETPPTLVPPSGAPDIKEERTIGSSDRRYCSYHPDEDEEPMSGSSSASDLPACLACGAPGARFIHGGSFGSNAGGTNCACYLCERCGLYTHTEHDWG